MYTFVVILLVATRTWGAVVVPSVSSSRSPHELRIPIHIERGLEDSSMMRIDATFKADPIRYTIDAPLYLSFESFSGFCRPLVAVANSESQAPVDIHEVQLRGLSILNEQTDITLPVHFDLPTEDNGRVVPNMIMSLGKQSVFSSLVSNFLITNNELVLNTVDPNLFHADGSFRGVGVRLLSEQNYIVSFSANLITLDNRPTKNIISEIFQYPGILDPFSSTTELPENQWVEFQDHLRNHGSLDEPGHYKPLESDPVLLSQLPTVFLSVALVDGSFFPLKITPQEYLEPTTREGVYKLLITESVARPESGIIGNVGFKRHGIFVDPSHDLVALFDTLSVSPDFLFFYFQIPIPFLDRMIHAMILVAIGILAADATQPVSEELLPDETLIIPFLKFVDSAYPYQINVTYKNADSCLSSSVYLTFESFPEIVRLVNPPKGNSSDQFSINEIHLHGISGSQASDAHTVFPITADLAHDEGDVPRLLVSLSRGSFFSSFYPNNIITPNELILNPTDPSLYAANGLLFTPRLYSLNEYMFSVTAEVIGHDNRPTKSVRGNIINHIALLDPSASMTQLPQSVWEEVRGLLQNRGLIFDGKFQLKEKDKSETSIADLPTIELSIELEDGSVFPLRITPNEYMREMPMERSPGPGWYELLIRESDQHNDTAVIGHNALKNNIVMSFDSENNNVALGLAITSEQ